MTLTIITVNYNSANHTIALLRSLEAQSDTLFDVIVVDNNSKLEDRALLGKYTSTSPLNLDIIYSETNRGFSGGNNIAIRKALAIGADWIVLLNPDTTVPTDFLTRLQQSLVHNGIIAIPVREGDGIAYAGILQWFNMTLPHLYDSSRLLATSHQLYAIGAGIAIHKSVFENIGLLDERYFLYFEDADFSMRARRSGINIDIAPMSITHAVSQTTKHLGGPLLLRYHARNALLFNWKHAPRYIRFALPFWSFFAILRQLAKMLLMPSRRLESWAIMLGVVDFYARRFGKISP